MATKNVLAILAASIALVGIVTACGNRPSPGPAGALPPASTEPGGAPAPQTQPAAPSGPATPPTQAGADWTVLVYVAADNNLEPMALINLEQMAKVGSTDRVKIVTQVDRSGNVDQGVGNLPKWSGAKRLYVEKDRFTELADLGQVNMSDPKTLTDFLVWGRHTYPATHYALVLWDHGGAWMGYATDDSSGGESLMSVPQIASALKESGLTPDFLGFDACLMANLEVALELQPYAKILVGSEESEPGLGWDYGAFLGPLARDPSLDPIDLGKAVADGYLANIKQNSPAESLYITMSVIDLKQIPNLGSTFAAFASNLGRNFDAATRGKATDRLARMGLVFGKARYDTPAFGRQDFNDPGLTFDLGLMVDNVFKNVQDDGVAQSGRELKTALAKAVPYSLSGSGFRDVRPGGISVAVPVVVSRSAKATDRIVRAYSGLAKIKETRWPDLTAAYAEAAKSDTVPPKVDAPKTDTDAVVPGRDKATITGQVTDETMVAGVEIGVTGFVGQNQVLVGFFDQPRTYNLVNSYSFIFDGMGWYLDYGDHSQLVFTATWQPGQRAVFGRYLQTPKSRPTAAFFIYDEVSGGLVQGFDVDGGALGALLPSSDSIFVPALFDENMKLYDTDPVAVRGTTLSRKPLPGGTYAITATGFDLANNHSTKGVLVSVKGGTQNGGGACDPPADDAAASYGTHKLRLTLDPGQTVNLKLPIDRNRVGKVLHDVSVVGLGDDATLRITAPDGQFVGSHGAISFGYATDSFDPPLSGVYTLTLSNPLTGQKRVDLSWTISARTRLTLPPTVDLGKAATDAFAQSGLHVGTFTVPAGKALSLSLTVDGAQTPWLGYSVEVPPGPQPLVFGAAGPDKQVLDAVPVCRLHMGGFSSAQSGEYNLVFDNTKGQQARPVTVWVELYRGRQPQPSTSPVPPPGTTPSGATTPAAPAAPMVQRLPDWATGDHSQNFNLAPGQVLWLTIPFDKNVSRSVTIVLANQGGAGTVKYKVLAPSSAVVLNGGNVGIFTQNGFAIDTTGDYTIVLDNSGNDNARTVHVNHYVTKR